MILGFTGPRDGPSGLQKLWLLGELIVRSPDEFHHGACIGSDAAAHWTAIKVGIPLIVVHPPINTKYMMALDTPEFHALGTKTSVIVLPAKGYHDRDRDIVDAADRVISTPAGEPTPRSGTWFTLNYALSQHKPISLCYPDGEEDTL